MILSSYVRRFQFVLKGKSGHEIIAAHPSVFVYDFKRTLKLAPTDLFGALGLCKQAINTQQIIMIILRVDIAHCSKLQSAADTSAFLFMKNITHP